MNKFSNRQFFLFGINYIVGFGFIATIGTLITAKSYGFLIFGVASFIALVVSLSFSKLSHKYPNTVGGSYAYSKYAFGKHMTFLQGWNQFLKGPVTSSATPLFLASIMQTFDNNDSNQIYYIVGSIALFSVLNIIATFGIKTNKYVIFATASLKWLVIFGAFVLLLYQVINGFMNSTINITVFESGKLTKLSVLFASIVSFVYAFGGIETLGTVSRDANVKNWRKLLMVVFLIILSFYFVVYMLYIIVPNFAIGEDGQASNTDAFSNLYQSTLGITGLILFGIGIFFNRISSISSTIYSNSREILALAEDNFLPTVLAKKNKHNEYKNTIILSAIINIISMLLFSILPKFLLSESTIQELFLNVITAGVLFFLVQYLLTLITALVLKRKKEIKINVVEQLLYILGIVVIFVIIIGTILPITFNIFPLSDDLLETWELKQTVLISSFFGLYILGFLIWYLNSLYSKRKKAQEKPLYFSKLNDEKIKKKNIVFGNSNLQKDSIFDHSDYKKNSKITLFDPKYKPKIKNRCKCFLK